MAVSYFTLNPSKPPFVTVGLIYPGASPDGVEKEVIDPVEEAISSIAGVKKVMGSAEDGFGQIMVEFQFEKPLGEATQDIRDAISGIRNDLPAELEEPIIKKFNDTDGPIVTLSSSDPLYSAAPESEIISLLIFGAPTFALDGQSQSTVRAVAGVLLPSAGGVVAGQLQRLLPVFNTIQVTTAGGQSDLTNASSLLDNLSISAGKQIGTRTFLRLNTGVCRGNSQSTLRLSSLWYGISAEYRLARGYMAQAGVDPGSAPCSRLAGDLFPRMQFGFDLFREWVF